MVGMQYASLIGQLSEKLNRVVNYHFFVPSPKMNFPGIEGFLKKYQAQAKDAGVDPLGFYQPPFAYAAMQMLEQAIKATGSLERRQARRTHPQERIQHDRRRGPLQRARRMGDRAPDRGAVPERARQRPRAIHDRPQAGDRPSRPSTRTASWCIRSMTSRAADDPVHTDRVMSLGAEIATMQITAAVARERFGAFTIEQLELTDPRAGRSAGAGSSRAACARPTSTAATATTTRRCPRCSATRAPASLRRSARA